VFPFQAEGTMGIDERKFLTRRETQRLLRISASKLDAEARSGRLKVHRFGRLVRIDADDLAEYIRQGRDRAAAELAR
jgi:excisionase family DNA binding protein